MKGRLAMVATMMMTVALAGCTAGGGIAEVEFQTSLGSFTVEVWGDKAPVTAENFLQYVVDGHFDGLTFHRIAPGFVVQGGGYLADQETLRATRAPIVNEASTSIKNLQWTLSMARTNDPDSATSQFFINLKANSNLDKTASSAGYAVFGEVTSGFDVIEAMTEVEAGQSFGAGGFFPADPIVIRSATIVSGDAPTPSPPIDWADVDTDAITPGATTITSTTDAVMVWAQHQGATAGPVDWSITGTGGAPLPDGWAVTIDPGVDGIGAVGGNHEAVYAIATFDVPSGASGDFALELHAGGATSPLAVTVDLDGGRVSQEGDEVTVEYAGSCVADGVQFDSGQFPLIIGAGRAVPGFDVGVIGLAQGEETTLVIPAPLGYGHDGGPCGGKDPADLWFDVSIASFDDA